VGDHRHGLRADRKHQRVVLQRAADRRRDDLSFGIDRLDGRGDIDGVGIARRVIQRDPSGSPDRERLLDGQAADR